MSTGHQPLTRSEVYFLVCCEALRDLRLGAAESAMLRVLRAELGLTQADALAGLRRARAAVEASPEGGSADFDGERAFARVCALARAAGAAGAEAEEVLDIVRRHLWIGPVRARALRDGGEPGADEAGVTPDIVFVEPDGTDPWEGVPYAEIFRAPRPRPRAAVRARRTPRR